MRILFLSSLYSTPLAPGRGIANARILHAMRAHADIRVMAPLPWYPRLLARRVDALRAVAAMPRQERDVDGASIVQHPRHLHLPRIGGPLQAGLYAASVLAPLRAEVQRFRPDVLLSAWAYPDGTAAVALGALLGLPTVVRTMGSDINDFARNPWRRPQIAWAMRRAQRVIAVSRALGRAVEDLGTPQQNIAVVPTGVDTRVFHPADGAALRASLGVAREPLILVPARLSREKGIHCFLDALAILQAGSAGRAAGDMGAAGAAGAHAVLVGDGPERRALAEQAARLGLEARVHFAGFQPEARMKHFYAAADLVCLPSLEEGWPNVLMESFACGCPVVASDVGGVPEIVALTGAGLTVPAGNAAALAHGLAQAMNRAWPREPIARTMQQHTLDATARGYLEVCAAAAA